MTDHEITKILAEKVMGWKVERVVWPASEEARKAGGNTYIDGPDTGFMEFDPLYRDTDSCNVLDKMVEDSWSYTIDAVPLFSSYQPGVRVRFRGQSVFPPSRFPEEKDLPSEWDMDRRRAICIAALKAVGAWVE